MSQAFVTTIDDILSFFVYYNEFEGSIEQKLMRLEQIAQTMLGKEELVTNLGHLTSSKGAIISNLNQDEANKMAFINSLMKAVECEHSLPLMNKLMQVLFIYLHPQADAMHPEDPIVDHIPHILPFTSLICSVIHDYLIVAIEEPLRSNNNDAMDEGQLDEADLRKREDRYELFLSTVNLVIVIATQVETWSDKYDIYLMVLQLLERYSTISEVDNMIDCYEDEARVIPVQKLVFALNKLVLRTGIQYYEMHETASLEAFDKVLANYSNHPDCTTNMYTGVANILSLVLSTLARKQSTAVPTCDVPPAIFKTVSQLFAGLEYHFQVASDFEEKAAEAAEAAGEDVEPEEFEYDVQFFFVFGRLSVFYLRLFGIPNNLENPNAKFSKELLNSIISKNQILNKVGEEHDLELTHMILLTVLMLHLQTKDIYAGTPVAERSEYIVSIFYSALIHQVSQAFRTCSAAVMASETFQPNSPNFHVAFMALRLLVSIIEHEYFIFQRDHPEALPLVCPHIAGEASNIYRKGNKPKIFDAFFVDGWGKFPQAFMEFLKYLAKQFERIATETALPVLSVAVAEGPGGKRKVSLPCCIFTEQRIAQSHQDFPLVYSIFDFCDIINRITLISPFHVTSLLTPKPPISSNSRYGSSDKPKEEPEPPRFETILQNLIGKVLFHGRRQGMLMQCIPDLIYGLAKGNDDRGSKLLTLYPDLMKEMLIPIDFFVNRLHRRPIPNEPPLNEDEVNARFVATKTIILSMLRLYSIAVDHTNKKNNFNTANLIKLGHFGLAQRLEVAVVGWLTEGESKVVAASQWDEDGRKALETFLFLYAELMVYDDNLPRRIASRKASQQIDSNTAAHVDGFVAMLAVAQGILLDPNARGADKPELVWCMNQWNQMKQTIGQLDSDVLPQAEAVHQQVFAR